MDSRRDISTMARTSPCTVAPSGRSPSHRGSTTWFDTIVDSAMVATITMDVADENPPRNASTASQSCPSAMGTVTTNRSGFALAGRRSSPTTAMGTTNRLMSARYSGNAHDAVIRCRSSLFSTTSTWNMRGRHSSAAPDRNVSASQRLPSVGTSAMGDALIRAAMGPSPPAAPQTTKTPTARSAVSLTSASSAMAVTTPWWRSLASRLRVPNRMVKTVSPTASQIAVACWFGSGHPSSPCVANTPKDRVTDCN